MKVKELIEKLKQCDPETVVIKSKDAEGNGYEEIDTVDTSCNMVVDGYYIEVGLRELMDGYSEEDLLDGEPVVILW